MSEFEGTVALVTGGGAGLGEAICTRLAAGGATVAVTDVSLPAATALARRLPGARAYQCDVADWDQVHAVAAEVGRDLGPVGILVCNAGVSQSVDLLRIEEKDWDRVLGVNLKGFFATLHAVLPGMAERRRGRVVYIGSISSKSAYPRFAHYTASKFGGLGLAQVAALEMARYGVTVNTVAPGVMDTPLQRGLVRQMVEENDFPDEAAAEKWFDDMLPLGGPQPVEDVAEMVAYLASEKARHITAASFHVDGGITPR